MLYKIEGDIKMESVLKFDRVVLVKELNDKIKRVGDVFEVANILDNSFLLRESKSKIAVGVISFEDFSKHFVLEESFKGWTPWTSFAGYDGQTDCFYRTNRKKTQVKFVTNNIRSEACLNKKEDEFNLYFGIQLAYLRCLNKAMIKKTDELQKEIHRLDKEILDNINTEKKMISSLGVQ